MNKNWLIKEQNPKLILFFNGWGMDKSAVCHLKSNNFDIVEFSDYSIIDFDANAYSDYKEIYVIAWSLGVWSAAFALQQESLPIKQAVAINGTLPAVHAEEGISPTIFERTLNEWSEKNRTRFQMRIIGGRRELATNASKFGTRNVENQKEELAALYLQIEKNNIPEFTFDTALIGSRDAIFSPENQEKHWSGKTTCHLIDVPHYPFLKLTSWNEILKF